jgi:hypothetical protein
VARCVVAAFSAGVTERDWGQCRFAWPTRSLRGLRVAALTFLLIGALDEQEVAHLADDRLRSDLRGLQARTEAELEEASGRRRLRLADDSVADD